MLSEKTIQEINRHTNPHSLLAITVKHLQKINTPFRVQCIKPLGEFSKGQMAYVESVHVSREHSLLYRIENKLYSFRYFRLNL